MDTKGVEKGMNSIKVSIIVPVYNVEKYLTKCLVSLVSQTLQEIEIIAVNDGTRDHSQRIIDKFAAEDSRIVSLQKKNGGLSDARNFGLQYARGKYIGFVDADDYVEPTMYEKLYMKAEETGSDMVECDLYHDYADGFDAEHGEPIMSRKKMLMLGRSVVWNKIYNRGWLQKTGVHFLKGLNYEDVAFYSMLLPYVRRVAYVPEALIHYVQREDSLNNTASLKTMDILKIIDAIRTFYKDRGIYEKYHCELEFLAARLILCSSFMRMAHIRNSGERKMALDASWEKLNEWYPQWHRNRYLRSLHTRNALFMKAMNPFSYKAASFLIPTGIALKNICPKKKNRMMMAMRNGKDKYYNSGV